MSLRSNISRIQRLTVGALAPLFGVILALVVGEIALWLILPAETVYRAKPPNLEVTFNAGQYAKGVRDPALFKTNSMGARGREWSADRESEYRILCLGGSTTESLLNDQDRIWTTLLEKRLGTLADGRKAWVGNIGTAGLASWHHVAQLKHSKVYDPDLIVVLVGSSDFMSLLKRSGGDSIPIDETDDERALVEDSFAVVPDRRFFDSKGPWYEALRLWRLGERFTQRMVGLSDIQDTEGRSLAQWRAMRASGRRSNELPLLEPALESYARNLEEMVRLVDGSGSSILLMTQPSIWRAGLTEVEKRQLWMGGVGEFRDVPGSLYYEPEAMERGMDAFNQRLLEFCQETGTPCLDLASAVPKSTQFFYDDEHFTDIGQEIVAKHVADAVLGLLRVSDQRSMNE